MIDLRDPEVAKGLTTGKGGLAALARPWHACHLSAPDSEVALDGRGANSPFNIALRANMVKPKC